MNDLSLHCFSFVEVGLFEDQQHTKKTMHRALLTRFTRPSTALRLSRREPFRKVTQPFSSFPSTLDHSQSPSAFISDKRYGKEHTSDEIMSFIDRYQRDEVKDYQMSAWLMAVCLKGMTPKEVSRQQLQARVL